MLDRDIEQDMGECEESLSVSSQSTLRGPMILAKVITDALENKKRVSGFEHEYAIAIIYKYVLGVLLTVHAYAGRGFRLWRGDRASLCLSDEGRRHEEMATRSTALCLSSRQRT